MAKEKAVINQKRIISKLVLTKAEKKMTDTVLSRKRLVIVIAFLIVFVFAAYFYLQYQNSQTLLNNPTKATDAQAKVIVEQVGKLIELPVGENPTIATVSDITKLLDQPFFSKAKNGDKVLLYSQSKMLILFRPSLNKIITVGTVNVAPTITASSPSVTPTLTPTPTAALKSSPTVTPTP